MREKIRKTIQTFTASYAARTEIQTQWEEPLVGFASANDPLFEKLKEVVSPTHAVPSDILPDAKTVIVYFFPFPKLLSRSNIKDRVASNQWAVAYVETNELIRQVSNQVQEVLATEKATSALIPATHNFSKEKLMSDWSHRHIGYIAGLGDFGLNNMLITEKGCCGRIGSLITSAEIQPDSRLDRPSCLYKYDGSCKKCVTRCVNQALFEDRFERFKCYEWLLENVKNYDSLGFAEVCGKCLVATPCAHNDPVRKKQSAQRERG